VNRYAFLNDCLYEISEDRFCGFINLQKLSIFGDLEYLRDIGDKSLLAAYAPQEISKQAPPLPIKVKVERI